MRWRAADGRGYRVHLLVPAPCFSSPISSEPDARPNRWSVRVLGLHASRRVAGLSTYIRRYGDLQNLEII
jgi:hypothetical protein